MLSVNDLSFAYGEEFVLQNISIHFEVNLIHGVVGLNGSGKTTFAKKPTAIQSEAEFEKLSEKRQSQFQQVFLEGEIP